jgi:hypothetical protein
MKKKNHKFIVDDLIICSIIRMLSKTIEGVITYIHTEEGFHGVTGSNQWFRQNRKDGSEGGEQGQAFRVRGD